MRTYCFRLIVIFCLLFCAMALGAEAPAEVPPPDTKPEGLNTREEIEARIKTLEAAKDLDENVRNTALKLCRDALAQVQARTQHLARIAELEAQPDKAPEITAKAEAELAALAEAKEYSPPPGLDSEAGQALLDKSAAELSAISQQLETLENLAAQQEERRKKLPALIRAANEKKAEIEAEKAKLPLPEDPPEVAGPRAAFMNLSLAATQAEIKRMELELVSHDLIQKLRRLNIEVLSKQEHKAKQKVETLKTLVEKLRREEAEAATRKAEEQLIAALKARPEISKLAEKNLELSSKRTGPEGTLKKIEEATRRLDNIEDLPEKLSQERQSILNKMEVAGMTNAIGVLMRKRRTELPDPRQLKRNVATRQDIISKVQLELIELRETRSELLSVDERVKSIMDNLDPPVSDKAKPRMEKQVRELLKQQQDLLQALVDDTNSYFAKLIDLDSKERELIIEVNEFNSFIDRYVLWMRSTTPLSLSDARQTIKALGWFFSPTPWAPFAQAAMDDIRSSRYLYIVALVLFVAALFARRKLIHRIERIGEKVSTDADDSFALTVKTCVFTVLASLPIPALLWFISWRLGSATLSLTLGKTAGPALRMVAGIYLPFEVFRQICRKGGLGEIHFRWPVNAVRAAHRTLVVWLVTVIPLIIVTVLCNESVNESYRDILRRLSLIAVMVVSSVLIYRLLRKGGPVFDYSDGGTLAGLRWLWFPALVIVPALLVLAAALGYVYTAEQLFWRVLATILLGLGAMTVQALVMRWVSIARNRLTEQEPGDQEGTEGGAPVSSAPGSNPPEQQEADVEPKPIQPSDEISPEDVGRQARTLTCWLILLVGAVALYFIWAHVFPAVGIVTQETMWGQPEASGGTGVVTLADVLLAIGFCVVLFIAARNLPGVLEITLLQRLPLTVGTRYAINTIARYIITVLGFLVIAGQLGLKWSSVQWLLAALTVGLGFGLQEIFANFMSGLILLFERPIRVGDTVTVGETSGTVTRIQIRATTITGWDRKELIVPNKEFITGRLTNWSLSDKILRATISVGVSYGSDPHQAEKILMRAARGCKAVLRDPKPRVLFLGYGDSSLDFEVRAFVPSIDVYLDTIDELHLRIFDALKRADIEIPFPQRDLHIRSISSPIPIENRQLQGTPTKQDEKTEPASE